MPYRRGRSSGPRAPCWSPDSGSIAFFAGGRLKRLDLGTGSVRDLAQLRSELGALNPSGCAWSREGVILFAQVSGAPIIRVSELGGTPVEATRLDAVPGIGIRAGHRSPRYLPDGRHFLFVSRGQGTYIGELGTQEARLLLDTAADQTADRATVFMSGHLLYIRQGTLLAQRFDPVSLALKCRSVSARGRSHRR